MYTLVLSCNLPPFSLSLLNVKPTISQLDNCNSIFTLNALMFPSKLFITSKEELSTIPPCTCTHVTSRMTP